MKNSKIISFLATAIYFAFGFFIVGTAETVNYFFLPFFALSWMYETELPSLSIFLYLVGFAAMWSLLFLLVDSIMQRMKKT